MRPAPTRLMSMPLDAAGLRNLALLMPVVVQAVLLCLVGPLMHPDSQGYMEYADAILRDGAWLSDAGVDASPVPVQTLRTVGYPLVIALCKILAPHGWTGLLVSLQCLAAVPASVVFYGFAARLFPGRPQVPVAASLLSSLSLSLMFHFSIMTDSLFASGFSYVLFSLLNAAWDRRAPSVRRLVFLGTIAGGTILLRPIGLGFALFLVPALVAALRRGRAHALAVLAFLAPLVAAPAAHAAWNAERTGHVFLSTVAQTDLLFPIFNMAGRGYGIDLAENSVIGPAAAEIGPSFDYPGVIAWSQHVWRHEGIDCFELGERSAAAFREFLRRHSLAYGAYMARNLAANYLHDVLDPMHLYREWVQAVTGHGSTIEARALWRTPGIFQNKVRTAGAMACFGFEIISGILSVLMIALPLLVARRGHLLTPDRRRAILYLWLVAAGFAATYALVRIEERFMLPVMPAMLLCLAMALELVMPGRRPVSAASAGP